MSSWDNHPYLFEKKKRVGRQKAPGDWSKPIENFYKDLERMHQDLHEFCQRNMNKGLKNDQLWAAIDVLRTQLIEVTRFVHEGRVVAIARREVGEQIEELRLLCEDYVELASCCIDLYELLYETGKLHVDPKLRARMNAATERSRKAAERYKVRAHIARRKLERLSQAVSEVA